MGTCSLALLVLFSLGEAGQDSKSPVPSDESQNKAERMIREIFKDEYAVKTSSAQLKLAKKLVEQGRETKDDEALRYVLFREAGDLAMRAGDADLLLHCLDE